MFQALAIFSMTALMVLPSTAQDTVYFSQGIAKGIVGADADAVTNAAVWAGS